MLIQLVKFTNGTTTSACGSCDYTQTLSRIVIRQIVTQDFFSLDSHRFLVGSGQQRAFYVNETLRSDISWTIINQTRLTGAFVYSSLAYRNIVSVDRVTDASSLTVTVSIKISNVEFIFPDKANTSSSSPTVRLEYLGLNVTETNEISLSNAKLIMKTVTTLVDEGGSGLPFVEFPMTIEAPEDGVLKVRLQFMTHQFEVFY